MWPQLVIHMISFYSYLHLISPLLNFSFFPEFPFLSFPSFALYSLARFLLSLSLSQRQTALFPSDPVQHQHNTGRWLLAEGAQRNRLQNIMQHCLINNLSETCCAAAAFLQWFWLPPQRTAEGQWLGSKSTNGIRRRQQCECVSEWERE